MQLNNAEETVIDDVKRFIATLLLSIALAIDIMPVFTRDYCFSKFPKHSESFADRSFDYMALTLFRASDAT